MVPFRNLGKVVPPRHEAMPHIWGIAYSYEFQPLYPEANLLSPRTYPFFLGVFFLSSPLSGFTGYFSFFGFGVFFTVFSTSKTAFSRLFTRALHPLFLSAPGRSHNPSNVFTL